MFVPTTLRRLDLEEALARAEGGAGLIDLRPVDPYLEVHIPRSLCLVYEAGPGMAARARDCLPLEMPLILLDDPSADMLNAAAALRGKGFAVLGAVEDAVGRWAARRGMPASTEVYEGRDPPTGILLDVGDPGIRIVEGTRNIPVETLWPRLGELDPRRRYVILAGYGVRAALAVGMLERTGVRGIVFWKTRGSLARGRRLSG